MRLAYRVPPSDWDPRGVLHLWAAVVKQATQDARYRVDMRRHSKWRAHARGAAEAISFLRSETCGLALHCLGISRDRVLRFAASCEDVWRKSPVCASYDRAAEALQ